jgi:glycosyltransferase involved in cell wall biosynthesis
MRHDVAIYTTSAFTAGFYDRARGRAGGAERQMTLLARALSERGYRVAHIIYPPQDPIALTYPLTLVHRDAYAGNRAVVGRFLEALRIWRALEVADARVTIVRTASPLVAVVGAYCKVRRRALIFSSANVSDLTLERISGRFNRAVYRLGVRLADAVVVQSDDQVALAHKAFPWLHKVVRIPSLAEPALDTAEEDRPTPEAFLWFGRFVPYKRPMRYVELARTLPEARFVMIPVPDEATSEELAELRRAAANVANLALRDPVPQEQLLELVAASVAVVNTSVLEGMPNAFLEAWARGVPVLTLSFDPDRVVERERLGIAARDDWERFVAGARELWAGRHDRDELARRVRAYVEDVHSMEAVGARWSELLAEVTGRR